MLVKALPLIAFSAGALVAAALIQGLKRKNEPKIWNPPKSIESLYAASAGNKFAAINSPKAGARANKDLEVGSAPLQLYSTATPNSFKVSILLEELGVEYDAHLISIMNGDQFNSGFVGINPNSKIPALVDKNGPDGKPISIFESAQIVLYLAEKYGKFLPKNAREKSEAMSWIFWQMSGQGPMSGNFGHFMVYAPKDKCDARDYGVARYGMEVQRLCSVLDNHLKDRKYMLGDDYSVVDIICFPWFYQLLTGYIHESGITAKDFLSVEQYKNVVNWAKRIHERPAVQRGLTVFKGGVPKPWLEAKKN